MPESLVAAVIYLLREDREARLRAGMTDTFEVDQLLRQLGVEP